ncbi:MAG: Copper amine oxidase domain protein [Desulfotomaculum sp. 46_296]|nr:MAG: Copper amine oxidase domain protein [Desulfotomaculum sp. 46_296]
MKFISKAFIMVWAIILALGFNTLPAGAAVPAGAKINICINGELLHFLEGEQTPEIIEGRVYVPLRVIGEDMGAQVNWIQKSRQVVINRKNKDFIPSSRGESGEIEIIIDGKTLAIPEGYGKALIRRGRTMVPLRVVGEAMDCKVDWESDTKTVVITSAVPVPPTNPEPAQPANAITLQLIKELAYYHSNLKLLDGRVINSGDLLNMDINEFSEEQLVRFESYLKELRKYPLTVVLPGGGEINPEAIGIMGTSQLTADQMEAYLAGEAPRIKTKMEKMGREFNSMPKLAELYLKIGEEYGIRGDIAYFQAVKETGYFQFTGSVQSWQNNYCGLWATGNPCTSEESLNGADPDQVRFEKGVHGAIFSSPEAGIEAHIQHLYAYATKNFLPEGKILVDPRFSLVDKGISPTWLQLNARWAVPGITYAQSILYDYWAKAF